MGNLTTISDRVQNRINNIPSSVTTSIIEEFATDAIQEFNNFSGLSVGTSTISDDYVPGITNWTCTYVLSYMTGVGVDFDYSIGEFNINKGGSNTNQQQLNFFADRVSSFLKSFGRKFSISKIDTTS